MGSDSSEKITAKQLENFAEAFNQNPKNRLSMNAVTKTSLHSVALSHDVVSKTNHSFSHKLTSNKATAQKKSGRCWLFSGLNVLRSEAMKNLNVKEFELSQNYQMFWDKLEKSNYFLESVIATLDEPTDGRLFMFLLKDPIQDGGQWDMFINLVKKYGVVPKQVMPETESSSNSSIMNFVVTTKLREYSAQLRKMHEKGESIDSLRDRKQEMLSVIYRMLCIHLGVPPKHFLWQWHDKDDQFHRDGEITGQEFFNKYVNYDLDSVACLINCPTADKPFEKMYTVEYLGNVVGGEIIRYLNVDMPVFKQAAIEMIKAGKPVWFGCDVGKMMERNLGILDMEVYDYGLVYDTAFVSDKAERVEYGQSVMTHAMVLTGVDLDESGHPVKWRVENSWGDKLGDKGFFVMSDHWFDEFMYEIAVEKRFMPSELLPVLETEPIRLHPWDPMGSLATAS
jgi:bleomycin hydrolase